MIGKSIPQFAREKGEQKHSTKANNKVNQNSFYEKSIHVPAGAKYECAASRRAAGRYISNN